MQDFIIPDVALLALVLKHAAVAITVILAGVGATSLASRWMTGVRPEEKDPQSERPRLEDISGLKTFKQIIGPSSAASFEPSDLTIQPGVLCNYCCTAKVKFQACFCTEF